MATRRMDSKRTMTMNWDGLDDDDDDDDFFEANNRISAVVPIDFHHLDLADDDDDDNDEFQDPRMSFAEGVPRPSNVGRPSSVGLGPLPPRSMQEDYDLWMAAPTSIPERRSRLLQGMGLNSSKELDRRLESSNKLLAAGPPPLHPAGGGEDNEPNDVAPTTSNNQGDDQNANHSAKSQAYSPDAGAEFLVRSRSDGDIDMFSIETKRRKEDLLGEVSKQRLTRTLSTLVLFTKMTYNVPEYHRETDKEAKKNKDKKKNNNTTMVMKGRDQIGAFFLIKNLDTGKEFVVKEYAEDGMWNRLSDLQTGRQMTMEEFEKSVGYSPVVKELMRREKGKGLSSIARKCSVKAISRRFRDSKKKGVSIIKKKLVGSASEKEHNSLPPTVPAIETATDTVTATVTANVDSNPEPAKSGRGGGVAPQSSEWVKVRTQGKTFKELTALRFCQEIQAHQGSISSIKFNFDGQFLASAGEDKVIHVWEVQECEVASLKPPEDSANDSSALEKKKKGRSGSQRGSSMPDYVQLPETVFSLSDEPVCSFEGHLDEVLDLSWSRTQLYLLSSSTDKTVRLWDLETKACLKLFAHNDYVTCIQFNPVNDEFFVSGSLDAKVRIWSVPGRRVVDWTDLHEMVTATCYTPDGQGVAVGSHKGNCRMYSITDSKLSQTIQFDIQNKKKSTPKITGFEFISDNSNEVLVTSTDSRIRIYDGPEVVQKFRGFRNGNSQSAASLSPDGKYVICSSEDSNVYVWKREEPKNVKTKTIIDTSSYECFQCKDVSVAIPWPGSTKFEPPIINLHAKKNSKKPPSSSTSSPKKEEVNMTSKKQLPPLPNNKKNTNNATDKSVNNENPNTSNTHKDDNNESNVEAEKEKEKGSDCSEADLAQMRQANSESNDSPSISSNQSSGSGSGSGSKVVSHGSDAMQARAWGLVIVTAGLGGEIRVYQNFGVPLKVGRQSFLA